MGNVVQMSMVASGSIDDAKQKAELALTKYQIIRLWEMKVLNDLAYVAMLLFHELRHKWKDRAEDCGGEFPTKLELSAKDYDYLCREWKGVTENDKGDFKELTCEAITKALLSMASKEFAITRTQQLSLYLSVEAPTVRG